MSTPVSEFLVRACAEAHERVAEARDLVGFDELRAAARSRPAPPGLAEALAAPGTAGGPAIIAELKRASPSRGHLAWLPDPAARAIAYTEGGARAVSVLTEPAHFRGTLADLEAVAHRVDVPVLRKDFLVDAYQVWEARAAGAAAALLIVAALDQGRMVELLRTTWEAGLDALIEVHEVEEAARAHEALREVRAGGSVTRPAIIGVNARDLRTLTVDPDRFAACVDALPADALAVAESGVAHPDDVARAAAAGAHAVLVGEHLVTAADPVGAVRTLAGAVGPRRPAVGQGRPVDAS
ncbi:indole-3-glycerol phosphate synthase TrpC [Egibacter rhizosphaerae]|uniref:indole-3-glycerol phosphate synthase TrpC n=1 Tax=Egibacter rhizosphaerae TaxID=1670831 RepID=UPI0013F16A32|nr:indole-3-glycerol phosphate synthase TrpC [Egibacter rhizosphaerae]